jgi:transcriptional regulator with XRE-family HTH domain
MKNFGDLPHWAIVLRGCRNREGLSQKSLGELIGITQTYISQMELGKRPIGKTFAKRFSNFFKTDSLKQGRI